ncbi:hypothetical protein AB0C96_25625 [Streptomyces sp. NPDC048506]|uniref:hypothetical protein n=1 Tax=Streptomyces sp. NPDC048506 TaxID=3155028 RepID=UPI003441FAA1
MPHHRLITAAALLLLATGCVAVPATHPDPAGAAHPRAATAAAQAPPGTGALTTPAQQRPRERLVVARPHKRPHLKPLHSGHPSPSGYPLQAHAPQQQGTTPAATPRRAVRPAHRADTPKRPAAGRRPRPRPRPPVDPRIMCRMASGEVRPDLLQLCRGMFGG